MGTATKKKAEVANPPPAGSPTRPSSSASVHFNEPPNETRIRSCACPSRRTSWISTRAKTARRLNDINLEVRVDNVGALMWPRLPDADLENEKQIVEVTFQAEGQDARGERPPTREFSWKLADQTEPRFWMVFTGNPDYIPKYKYQVRVMVKGSIFTKGKEWIGPWQDASGNGPIMLSVPTPEDAGVTMKDLVVPMTRSRITALAAKPSGERPPAGKKAPPAKKREVTTPTLHADGWSIEPPQTGVPAPDATTAMTKARESAPQTLSSEATGWTPLQPQAQLPATNGRG